ncbi:MAG: hypothetical protein LBD82_05920 [Deltaproteobacteria bacterium]|nr:hypothetical protein [Deltaproteobacteria bacterium]
MRVKYCGGCNPRYNRAELTRRLREDFPALRIMETEEAGPALFVAVLCGCGTACAAHAELNGLAGKMILTSQQDYGDLAAALRNLAETCTGETR